VTFFVDANVILYAVGNGEQSEACAELMAAIMDGADGRTSSAVLEEVWHLERSGRMGDLKGIAADAYRAFTPLLSVTDEVFARALAVEEPRLGTADRLHVGTCLAHGIDTIVTADRGFDGVRGVRRIDPLDAAARRRLLR
jgi:predicted nucleic acid-binding protein